MWWATCRAAADRRPLTQHRCRAAPRPWQQVRAVRYASTTHGTQEQEEFRHNGTLNSLNTPVLAALRYFLPVQRGAQPFDNASPVCSVGESTDRGFRSWHGGALRRASALATHSIRMILRLSRQRDHPAEARLYPLRLPALEGKLSKAVLIVRAQGAYFRKVIHYLLQERGGSRQPSCQQSCAPTWPAGAQLSPRPVPQSMGALASGATSATSGKGRG